MVTLYEANQSEIKIAIAECIKRRDRHPAEHESDFCVFIHENGWLVMHKDGYAKLPKKQKTLINKSYKYKSIAC